jgi:predicted phosphodiesterase
MRILPLSDLHLELTSADWDLPELPEFDVLVMAGDLCPGMATGVEWLAERIGDRDAVYVAGNHEFYGSRDINSTIAEARAAAVGTRVHVLSDSSVDLRGTTFIGSTLWTDYALLGRPEDAMFVASELMNDFRQILDDGHLLRPSDVLARYIASRRFIADELTRTEGDGRKRVVVTHHGVLADQGRPGMLGRLISASYCNAMDAFVSDCGADLWVCGHTHVEVDKVVGRTRVINNGKGYGPGPSRSRHDNESFDPTLIIEI